MMNNNSLFMAKECFTRTPDSDPFGFQLTRFNATCSLFYDKVFSDIPLGSIRRVMVCCPRLYCLFLENKRHISSSPLPVQIPPAPIQFIMIRANKISKKSSLLFLYETKGFNPIVVVAWSALVWLRVGAKSKVIILYFSGWLSSELQTKDSSGRPDLADDASWKRLPRTVGIWANDDDDAVVVVLVPSV